MKHSHPRCWREPENKAAQWGRALAPAQSQLPRKQSPQWEGQEPSRLRAASAPDKELEAVVLIGLGQQGRKPTSGGGGGRKSHFSSESSKFSSSPSYSPLPSQLRFPAGLTPWKSPSTPSFSGFGALPPVLMQRCWWLQAQGNTGPRRNAAFQTLETALFPLSQYTVGGRRCCPVGGLPHFCPVITAHNPR